MPLLTFYALLGSSRKRVPTISINKYPTDWLQLKELLVEVMRKVCLEHGETEAEITMEKHLPGKFILKFSRGSYKQQKVRYKREFEAYFKVAFNPKNRTIQVKTATFTPILMNLAADFWQMERNIQYRAPPLIPREHQNILENPKLILTEPSATRYADYNKPQTPFYQTKLKKQQVKFSYSRPNFSFRAS